MLTSQRRIARRTVAVLLTLVMLNIYVMMGVRTSQASTNTTSENSNSGKLLVGRLSLADQQTIFVNGNEARTGTSIFSGMRLQSPTGVSAAVQLGALGQISLEPNTDLTLDFSTGHVAVSVAAGGATLTTNDGVEATLTGADGNVLKSNGTNAAVLSTNSAAAAAKMSGRRKALWWILGITAVVVITIVAVEISDDDSPSSP